MLERLVILQWWSGNNTYLDEIYGPGENEKYPKGLYTIINPIDFPTYISYAVTTINNVYSVPNDNLTYQWENSPYWRRRARFHPPYNISTGYSYWGIYLGY